MFEQAGFESRPHGFRVSFRTWCEGEADTDFAVKEAALGHLAETVNLHAITLSDTKILAFVCASPEHGFLYSLSNCRH